MWRLCFIWYLPPTINISLLSVGHLLIHWDSAVLSSAGYFSKGLIPFWLLSLSLPLLSFSLWFKQNTSVSQAVNLSLFMSAKYTRGKKAIYYTFTTEEDWMAWEIGNEPRCWSYRHSIEIHMLFTNSKIYLCLYRDSL